MEIPAGTLKLVGVSEPKQMSDDAWYIEYQYEFTTPDYKTCCGKDGE